jgi:hypothetical protein
MTRDNHFAQMRQDRVRRRLGLRRIGQGASLLRALACRFGRHPFRVSQGRFAFGPRLLPYTDTPSNAQGFGPTLLIAPMQRSLLAGLEIVS